MAESKSTFELFNNLGYFMSKTFFELSDDEKIVWFNEVARKLKGSFLVYERVEQPNPDKTYRTAVVTRIKRGEDFYGLPLSEFDDYCNFYGIVNNIILNLDTHKSTDVKEAVKGINRYNLRSLCITSAEAKQACIALREASSSATEAHIDEYHVRNLSKDNIAIVSEWFLMPVEYMVDENVLEKNWKQQQAEADRIALENARVPQNLEAKKEWAVNMLELLKGCYIVTPTDITKIITVHDVIQIPDVYWDAYARTCNKIFDLVVANRANQMLHNEPATFMPIDLLKYEDTKTIADNSPICLSFEQFAQACSRIMISDYNVTIRVANLTASEKKVLYDGSTRASSANSALYNVQPVLMDISKPIDTSRVPRAVLDDAAKAYIASHKQS